MSCSTTVLGIQLQENYKGMFRRHDKPR